MGVVDLNHCSVHRALVLKCDTINGVVELNHCSVHMALVLTCDRDIHRLCTTGHVQPCWSKVLCKIHKIHMGGGWDVGAEGWRLLTSITVLCVHRTLVLKCPPGKS